MKIVIKESQLKKIISQELSEQSVIGAANYGSSAFQKSAPTKKRVYPCVPESYEPFVIYIMSNLPSLQKKLGFDSKTIISLTKYALGVIGRETEYGEYEEYSDAASEMIRNIGLGGVLDFVQKKISPGKTQSLGHAQFTPDSWQKYGLDKTIGPYNSSFTTMSQGLASLFRLVQDYRLALSKGISTQPSTNPTIQKYMGKTINGTGNNALDLAIIAHNFGSKKIVPYCKTNNELWSCPCNKSTCDPWNGDPKSFESFKAKSNLLKSPKIPEEQKKYPGMMKVDQSAKIDGFFPNMSGGKHTSIGYLEEVVANAKKLNCF